MIRRFLATASSLALAIAPAFAQQQSGGAPPMVPGLSATPSNLASGAAAANLGFTPLNPVNNLSDLTSPSTARTSMGLGALATTTPGTGVSSALGNAANSSGGVVTSPVGGSLVTFTPAGTLRQGLSNSPQSNYLPGRQRQLLRRARLRRVDRERHDLGRLAPAHAVLDLGLFARR